MTPGIVAESDLSGNLKSEYVFFDGERVARKDFPGNTVAYYFSDHLKTASVITDSAGNIKADSDYYPWGGELQFVNNDSNHYKFASKERDSETGLDYFGARYYSNGLGRWVSADWSATPVPVPYANFGDPQSLNLYGFVAGNPASRADQDGHQQSDCICQLIQHALSAAQENNTRFMVGVTGLIFHGYVAAHNFFSGNKPVPPPPPAAVPGQKAEPSTAAGAVPGTQTKTDAKPGTLGKPDHRATVKAETDRISGKSEVKIPTPTGSKDYRRADAVGTNPETGSPEIVQVYRPTPAGNIPKREVDAASDIEEATGVKPTMVPVRPVPGKQDGIPK